MTNEQKKSILNSLEFLTIIIEEGSGPIGAISNLLTILFILFICYVLNK